MASTVKGGPQDLPPKGGYAPYPIERVELRTIIGGRLGIGLFLAATVGGLFRYAQRYYEIKRHDIEMRSSRLAITPLLIAERDRSILKQMRLVRDEEAELMKHVSTWEVGTFFGEPIYHTVDPDEYQEPSIYELTIHSDPQSYLGHLYYFMFT